MQGISLAGRSILIVEDEPIIALDIVTAFTNAGAVVLAARSLAEASRLVEHDGLSAAIVDFGLGDHDAGALCGAWNSGVPPLSCTVDTPNTGQPAGAGSWFRNPPILPR